MTPPSIGDDARVHEPSNDPATTFESMNSRG
jgi:hypothetical protein